MASRDNKPAEQKPAKAEKLEIQFNGEPHHRLVLKNGKDVWGGKTALVGADEAHELLAAPWANVTPADKKQPQWPQTDEELDALAERFEVEFPTGGAGGGLPELTVGGKIAYLEAAGFTPADIA
jgi:hypothetical protein